MWINTWSLFSAQCPRRQSCGSIPGHCSPLNVRAANHVDEIDMAVAVPRLNVAPGPLRPVIRILVLAKTGFLI
jgi:hypothetical protein